MAKALVEKMNNAKPSTIVGAVFETETESDEGAVPDAGETLSHDPPVEALAVAVQASVPAVS